MAIALVARRYAVAAVITAAAGTGNAAWNDLYVDILEDEGMVLKPYVDTAGIETVCVGDTIIEMKEYTAIECSEHFIYRVNQVRGQVERCTYDSVWGRVPQPSKEAFVSFTYNVGSGAFCKYSVAKNINRGEPLRACGRMRLYNKARDPQTGKLKISRGLMNRREREAAKCEGGFA